MQTFSKKILFKVIFAGILMFLLFQLIFLGYKAYNTQSDMNVLYQKADAVEAQIEQIFQSTITISDGYFSYMTSNLDASQEDTQEFLKYLLSYEGSYVMSIATIQDTSIKYNYPYEENQVSIGVDLSTIESQKDDVLLVKNTLEPYFIGPVELVQGGQGFIVRIPILDGEEYWGQIAIVINADLFIQTISDEADSNQVSVKISYADSLESLLLFGEESQGNSVSSTYENKYTSWVITVTDTAKEAIPFINYAFYLAAIMTIMTICYFLYRSLQLNRKILFNAKHDYLTGDYNRSKFISDYKDDRFKGMLIAFTDINKFKIINDTLGHLFGDWCLVQLSNQFRKLEQIRTYRMSGDEFILVSTVPMSIEDFKNQIDSNKFVFYNQELKQNVDLEISIGVLEGLDDKISLEKILMYLDYAMYDAKKENKGFTLVNKELMNQYDKIKLIEQQLIDDVKNQKLIPYYQAIINLETGKIAGFEVLSRWLYNGEIRSAAMFIDVVKKVRYVDLVDQNLFDKLQEEYKELVEECDKLKDMTFSVNLSAESLMIFEKNNSKFDDFVKNRIIPIEKSTFEVSEDMNLGVISIDTLRYIQEDGYSISVDDFGSGISKLSDVLSGELGVIKTDKSLLPSKRSNDKKATAFTTIIKAIRISGSSICAEGVETVEQMEIATEAGCKLAQGYLFSKAIPKEEVIDFVRQFDFSKYQ